MSRPALRHRPRSVEVLAWLRLVRVYQKVERTAMEHLRAWQLSVPQFDILAHVDVPKRVGYDVYGHFDSCDYEEGIRTIWEACLEKQIIPEINTKGMRCSVAQLHPTTDALQWYVQMGGQTISFGSDAHQRDSVGGDFDLAFQSAQEAGLSYLARFERRKLISAVAI